MKLFKASRACPEQDDPRTQTELPGHESTYGGGGVQQIPPIPVGSQQLYRSENDQINIYAFIQCSIHLTLKKSIPTIINYASCST